MGGRLLSPFPAWAPSEGGEWACQASLRPSRHERLLPALPRNEYIKVAAGSNFLGRSNVTRWVQKVLMHPQYSTKTYDNDIALLLLQEPIPYSWYHSAVCLPDDSIVPDDNLWENCFVAGWGLTRAGEPPRGPAAGVLRKGAVEPPPTSPSRALLAQAKAHLSIRSGRGGWGAVHS